MSQNVQVRLVDEDNKVIKDFNINLAELLYKLRNLEEIKNFKIIASIDEYGKTLLNKRQCLFAVEELNDMFNKRLLGEDPKIDQLTDILSKVNEHEYLLFIGD